jgi:hypothetical protein
MRRLLIAAVLLIATLAVAVPARSATVRVQRFFDFRDVPVAGTPTRYRLRVRYVVPRTWRQTGRPNALSRTFGHIGSCNFTVRVRARAVTGQDEPATSRVARLVPQTGRLLLDVGTRSNAAWRVARTPGADTVTGLLVRPAPSVRTQPSPSRVWLELRFSATADPRRECHIGGPRTVGAQTGDALATAVVGGFQL